MPMFLRASHAVSVNTVVGTIIGGISQRGVAVVIVISMLCPQYVARTKDMRYIVTRMDNACKREIIVVGNQLLIRRTLL